MMDSLWFVIVLVLLAVVSVALVLVLVLRREELRDGRETRTEYLQPNYGQTGGFRVASTPNNEIIIPYPTGSSRDASRKSITTLYLGGG